MEVKYRALRILSWVFRIIAVLIMLGGVAFGVLLAVTPSIQIDYSNLDGIRVIPAPPLVGPGIGLALSSVLISLFLYAFGQLLNLFMDLEENSRRTNILLQKLGRSQSAIVKPSRDNDDEPSIGNIVGRRT